MAKKKVLINVGGKIKEMPNTDSIHVEGGITFNANQTPANPDTGTFNVYMGAEQNNLYSKNNGGTIVKIAPKEFNIHLIFNNGTSLIPVNETIGIYIDSNFTISQYTLGSIDSISGSITIDIWKDTHANYPPTVADTITGSDKPRITSATKGQSSALTGWTTSHTGGAWWFFVVESNTNMKHISLSLSCLKT